MPKVKIDELEYNTEDLTERGLSIVKSLQFVETQLKELEREIAVYQTSKNTYTQGLLAEIKAAGVKPIAADDQPSTSDE